MEWLQNKLAELYQVKGFIKHHQGAGVYGIQYVKGDTEKLFQIMHLQDDRLYLKRKYDKIKNTLEFGTKIKLQIPGLKNFRLIQLMPG